MWMAASVGGESVLMHGVPKMHQDGLLKSCSDGEISVAESERDVFVTLISLPVHCGGGWCCGHRLSLF